MPVRIDVRPDHVVLRLEGAAALATLRRSLVIPYSDVAAVEVGPPERPPPIVWRVGTHLPGALYMGSFRHGGRRRFLHFDRRARTALKLRLRGHPAFDEVEVAVDDPEAARRAIAAHLRAP